MTQPLDPREPRCLDAGCPERMRCRRFLEHSANTNSRTCFIATCWTPDGEHSYPGYLQAREVERV